MAYAARTLHHEGAEPLPSSQGHRSGTQRIAGILWNKHEHFDLSRFEQCMTSGSAYVRCDEQEGYRYLYAAHYDSTALVYIGRTSDAADTGQTLMMVADAADMHLFSFAEAIGTELDWLTDMHIVRTAPLERQFITEQFRKAGSGRYISRLRKILPYASPLYDALAADGFFSAAAPGGSEACNPMSLSIV